MVVAFFKLEKVVVEKLPLRGLLRRPSSVYFHIAAAFHIDHGLPAKEHEPRPKGRGSLGNEAQKANQFIILTFFVPR